MRRPIAVLASILAALAPACAVIAGLDEPSEVDEDAGVEKGDPDATGSDETSTDAGAAVDADAGRKCTGTPLKSDSFDDRTTDAAAGWTRDYRGDGGVVEIVDGGLHVVVPPVTSGVNAHRHLEVTKNAAKRMCVSFTVSIVKPGASTLGSFFDAGNTTFGFLAAEAADATTFTGIAVDSEGALAYTTGDDAGNTRRHLPIALGTKWNVVVDADFVANQAVVAIDGREETFSMIRPADSPSVFFALGIRNLGPTPEAEAYFDDVIVTAE